MRRGRSSELDSIPLALGNMLPGRSSGRSLWIKCCGGPSAERSNHGGLRRETWLLGSGHSRCLKRHPAEIPRSGVPSRRTACRPSPHGQWEGQVGKRADFQPPSNLTKIPWNSREAAAAIWLPWTERQACGSVSAARYPSPPRPFAFRALPLQKVGAVGSRPFTRGRGSWAQTQAGRLGQGQPGVPAAAGHRCW